MQYYITVVTPLEKREKARESAMKKKKYYKLRYLRKLNPKLSSTFPPIKYQVNILPPKPMFSI